jgi:Flp pilus assembly protein TadG
MKVADWFIASLPPIRKPSPRRRFLADRKGTTAIEFAMISVPFIGLIGAIFETGMAYFRTAQLQMATETASRAVLTHSTAAGLTYQQFINQNVCTWQSTGTVKPGTLGTMFDCSKLLVDITSPSSWNTTTDLSSFTAGAAGSVIAMPTSGNIGLVRIVYPMTMVMGILSGATVGGVGITKITAGPNNNNFSSQTYALVGIAAFRVEP